jgi:hypothetical protein
MLKQFTTLQLFSLTDGRLGPGGMDDVYDILGHICGDDSISTIGLTVVYDALKNKNPIWFKEQVDRLNTIKSIVGDDYELLIAAIRDKYNKVVSVPQFND